MKTGTTILIGAGVLLLLSGIGGNPLPEEQILTPEDYDLLADDPDKITTLLGNDTSPVAFNVPAGQWTEEERLAIVGQITNKYTDKITRIATALEAEVSTIGNGILLIIEQEEGVVKETSIKLYLDMLGQWSERVSSAAESCANAIAKIAETTGIAIGQANTCTQTTFIKSVTEDVRYESESWQKVKISNKGSAGIFGLFRSGKSGKTIEDFKKEVRTDHREIIYVPHCTNWQIDPAKIEALLGNSTLAMTTVYSVLRAVIKTIPDPKYFVA